MTTQSDKAPALELKNLNYTYVNDWTRHKICALRNVNLEVFAGESFGFLGHNGAGKTTTIKCILHLIRPLKGQILIFGLPSSSAQARREVGYLAEQPYFYDNLTVLELMQMYAALLEIPRPRRKDSIMQALELVKLTERHNLRMRALSKGLLQRVAMAQAIVGRPRLLILDEPFSGLDPIGRKEFRELLTNLKQAGTTIFMSSHILSDVEFLCDRVSILAHGEIKGIFELRNLPDAASGVFELVVRRNEQFIKILDGLYQEIKAENKFLRFFFKDRGPAEKALQLALQHQVAIESFEFVHGGLEELFVKLVKSAATRP